MLTEAEEAIVGWLRAEHVRLVDENANLRYNLELRDKFIVEQDLVYPVFTDWLREKGHLTDA